MSLPLFPCSAVLTHPSEAIKNVLACSCTSCCDYHLLKSSTTETPFSVRTAGSPAQKGLLQVTPASGNRRRDRNAFCFMFAVVSHELNWGTWMRLLDITKYDLLSRKKEHKLHLELVLSNKEKRVATDIGVNCKEWKFG